MNKSYLIRATRRVIVKTINKGQKIIINLMPVQRLLKDINGKYGVDCIDFPLFDRRHNFLLNVYFKSYFIERAERLQ